MSPTATSNLSQVPSRSLRYRRRPLTPRYGARCSTSVDSGSIITPRSTSRIVRSTSRAANASNSSRTTRTFRSPAPATAALVGRVGFALGGVVELAAVAHGEDERAGLDARRQMEEPILARDPVIQ